MSEKATEPGSHAVNEKPNAEYVAPVIESVVTPECLEREVHYAGTITGPPPPP